MFYFRTSRFCCDAINYRRITNRHHITKLILCALLTFSTACAQTNVKLEESNTGIGQDTPIVWNQSLSYCTPSSTTPGHPGPQFRLPSATKTMEGSVTSFRTAETCLPEPKIDPFTLPPGTNLLPNVYTDMIDGTGAVMPNTLPSTPNIPYNLHDGHPLVSSLDNAISPNDDLHDVVFGLQKTISEENSSETIDWLHFGIDILEGNPIENRSYSTFPVLHYNGPTKEKTVSKDTKVVKVKQIWYDEHIESDTAFIDLSELDPEDTWIIEYTVDVLSRGEDDFSPFTMYFDDPNLGEPDQRPLPHIGMDQSFFPMQEKTRTVFRIKMSRAKYFNLTYTWGWRVHPPRIQAMENSKKKFPGHGKTATDTQGNEVTPLTGLEWEQKVFGDNPLENQAAKVKAINMIGDLSPAKRMWNAFRSADEAINANNWELAKSHADEAKSAYFDWRTRSRLPAGVPVNKDGADIRLLYVNNTIYGEFIDEEKPLKFPEVRWPEWKKRADHKLKVSLYNGDYYQHAYHNVDFGGARGWENQFKSSTKVGGSGCWFTFGRAHWMFNISPVILAPSPGGTETENHQIEIVYDYEPSTRLRFYQFDPMHHDVGIYSIH